MNKAVFLLLLCLWAYSVDAEDPYKFHTWHVTYGTISPLGVPKQGILINGHFPGPTINCTSNNNIVVNVFNHLDEPLIISWQGIQHRKNSWQDGTPGTMCPIAPGTNYTYKFQPKDQIGTYFYFPTTALHRSAGAIGMLKVQSRELIPIPFENPAVDFSVLVGDWFNKGHKTLKQILDSGRSFCRPDGILINGKSDKVGDPAVKPMFTMEAGKTYRYRVCNVGLKLSVNFRFQGHPVRVVEIEGSHTVQNVYDSVDLHVGQCVSVLVKADQNPKDYYLVASSRFHKQPLQAVAVIRYNGSNVPASLELPTPPPENIAGLAWSINQFRSFRWNLTANAARPNPQGSYKYGKINITRTIKIANSRYVSEGKLRFGINGVSHVDTDTPLKLAEYFGVADKVFQYDLVKDEPPRDSSAKVVVAPSVVNATFKNFVEFIFENREKTMQTYHLDGYSFFAVAMEFGRWGPEKRKNYNLMDAVSRNTIQVYPGSWAAVMTTLDNAGMWNLRSEMRERAYLGQQLYISVLSPELSLRDEYNIPPTQQLCGIVQNMTRPAPYS